MVEINIKLLGVAKDAAGRDRDTITIPECADVYEALRTLIDIHGQPLRDALLDPVTESPVATLILLNGVEIGNLQGLESPLNHGDELVFLSVTHGG
jgi:molybdopterin converting factor small subunit